jgi:hypothetical protein
VILIQDIAAHVGLLTRLSLLSVTTASHRVLS